MRLTLAAGAIPRRYHVVLSPRVSVVCRDARSAARMELWLANAMTPNPAT